MSFLVVVVVVVVIIIIIIIILQLAVLRHLGRTDEPAAVGSERRCLSGDR